ncbi:DUF2568 domain-containing protein [Undibacterium arcticum]
MVVPIAAAAVWGAFAVPGDASRSGSAPIAVSGVLRLGIEVTFFAFAARALYETGGTSLGLIFLAPRLSFTMRSRTTASRGSCVPDPSIGHCLGC